MQRSVVGRRGSSPTDQEVSGHSQWSVLVGLGLTSASSILLEVALTRLYSAVLFYHYVFAVVSMAVAGLAGGAILSHRLGLAEGTWQAFCRGQSRLTAVGAGSVAVALGVVVWIPAGETWGTYAAYFVPATLPFVFFGMVLSAWFRRLPHRIHALYFADLTGGGLAAITVQPILDSLGGTNALLFIAVVGALGGIAFSLAGPEVRIPGLASWAALFFVALLMGNVWRPTLDLRMDARPHATKTLYAALAGTPGARLIYTDWDSVGRVDVVDLPGRAERWLYVDAGSWSRMVRFRGDYREARHLQGDIAYFPLLWKVPSSMLVIGPGGGIDVLLGLMAGVKEITAVELNPGAVRAVRRMGDYNGGIYDRPDVAVLVDNGRAFLRRSPRRYDLIYLSQAVTESAELLGYSLAESSLYTREAFREYLDHLSEHGRIAFVFHNVFNLTKAFLTALDVLQTGGKSVAEAAAHLLVINGVDSDTAVTPLLVLSRQPISQAEEQEVIGLAKDRHFRPLFTPRLTGGDMSQLVYGGKSGIRQFLETVPYRLEPATDESPFFHQFYKGIPPHLLLVLGGTSLMALGIVAWVLVSASDGLLIQLRLGQAAIFSLLGLSFMFIEIPLIQRISLLASNPTVGMALVLFALLVPGGLGSLLASRRIGSGKDLTRNLAWICGAVGATVLLLVAISPGVLARATAQGGWYRVILPGALIAPLGFFLGMPFPLCLAGIGTLFPSRVSQLWALNAMMSVVGSILALIGSILYGISVVMAAAAGLYVIVGGLVAALGRVESDPRPMSEGSLWDTT